MTPDELDEAKTWLNKVAGVVTAPTLRTCRSANGGRVLDYVVIVARMQGAIADIWTDQDFPASPHNAVVVRFNCVASRDRAMILVRPKAFPLDKPIGCPRPAKKTVPDVACKLDMVDDAGVALDDLFTDIAGCAEEEWCLLCDEVIDDSSTPSSSYCGRAAGPRYKWDQILHNCDGSLGRSDDVGLGLTLLCEILQGTRGNNT